MVSHQLYVGGLSTLMDCRNSLQMVPPAITMTGSIFYPVSKIRLLKIRHRCLTDCLTDRRFYYLREFFRHELLWQDNTKETKIRSKMRWTTKRTNRNRLQSENEVVCLIFSPQIYSGGSGCHSCEGRNPEKKNGFRNKCGMTNESAMGG